MVNGHDESNNAVTANVHVRINHKLTTIAYRTGDTILETARRNMLYPPFSCRRGDCGTCRALVEAGTATMRSNNILTPTDVRDGWILTCQATPTSKEISVSYDARRLLPGLRSLIRIVMRNKTTGRSALTKP